MRRLVGGVLIAGAMFVGCPPPVVPPIDLTAGDAGVDAGTETREVGTTSLRLTSADGGIVAAFDASCADPTKPMRVHFLDVEQALSVFVELPDGQTILVDVGLKKNEVSKHIVDFLRPRLNGRPLSMLWITHQHDDHLGGAAWVFDAGIRTQWLVDNGTLPSEPKVKNLRAAVRDAGYKSVSPQDAGIPIAVAPPLELVAVVPPSWRNHCNDQNDCSIGLLVRYCASSVLFTGDATDHEEEAWSAPQATLLQVGHHGSDTSTTPRLLDAVQPRYAVISSGKRTEGDNGGYCHPRRSVVDRLVARLGAWDGGSDGGRFVEAFDFDRADDAGVKCRKDAGSTYWPKVPGSERLWLTLDEDVTLETIGDGAFRKVPTP